MYDYFKRSYAEMLYRWGLLVHRSKILKYLSSNSDVSRGVEFVTECMSCTKVTPAPLCKDCHKPLLYCSLCRLPVRGSANACLSCGHGGHTNHMKRWFLVSLYGTLQLELSKVCTLQKNDVCATGCGCHCLKESANIVDF